MTFFTLNSIVMKKEKRLSSHGIVLQVEVTTPILIKVKSYFRFRSGKREKVRSHLRRIGTAKRMIIQLLAP